MVYKCESSYIAPVFHYDNYDIYPISLYHKYSTISITHNTHITPPYCIYVAVTATNDTVVGFYSISAYNSRQCYSHIASLSIYVHQQYRGQHIGTQLLQHSEQICTQYNVLKIILAVIAHNNIALSLYNEYGYRTVGRHIKQGRINDKWVDTVILEKILIDTP